MQLRPVILLILFFILLSSVSAEIQRPEFANRLEYTGSLTPQFHENGTGRSLEGGLFLHMKKVPRFEVYSAATLELQYIESDIHREFDLLCNLKGMGVVGEKVLPDIHIPVIKKDFSLRAGSMVSLRLGGGMINYWRSEDDAYLPLSVISIRPGAGLFLEGEKFMLNLELCYQIDLTKASPRTFISIPLSFTWHGSPAFGGK